ncbi:recombinase family protein [Sphingorhabdus sp. EL138]|uniref:recombinase family protein n=1 Tax=Sphingorhabdus sp. EL138 TaxID=2073156 RepID=UPI000D69620C|nr:recombinase family protein [Sphingorhabdus sp. EL138]
MESEEAKPIVRCAIYTRKSTEEGLDREVNSLEAQRDTCSAYIRSQRHRGWVELAEQYDDGGRSGANLSRPALQKLMAHIEDGRIDVVVIYKIDRLSRSLLDFVRLIDTFQRFDVAFVSITQAFDTSDSMGRLVLNVLLTFAQFERELMADRIRDKFAVLKRKGKWTGGRAPFGYDKVDKKLVIFEPEAKIVRDIYERYPKARSGNSLLQQLRAEGVHNKVRITQAGRAEGGHLFGPGILHRVLTNPLYLGKVDYDGQWYEGEHDAIVTQAQWDRVQTRRAERHECQIPRRRTSAMLQGILFDTYNRRMHPELVERKEKRFRYYATELSREGKRQRLKVVRTGADEVEALAVAAIRGLLVDRPALSDAISALGQYDGKTSMLLGKGRQIAIKLGSLDPQAVNSVVRTIVKRAELDRERLRLFVSCFELSRLLDWDAVGLFKAGGQIPTRLQSRTYPLDAPAAIVREARQVCLPIAVASNASMTDPNQKLLKLLDDARDAQAAVYANREMTFDQIARQQGHAPAAFSRLVRLNYLAPDIVTAIIDGTHPPGLKRSEFLKMPVPLDWSQQRLVFGFPAQPPDGQMMRNTARGHAPRRSEL